MDKINTSVELSTKRTRIRIHEPLPWIVEEDKQVGGYVATNKALNLTTQGENWNELLEMIVDVTDLLFRSLHETNEIEGFLTSRGLKFSAVPAREETFNVRPVDVASPITFAQASA